VAAVQPPPISSHGGSAAAPAPVAIVALPRARGRARDLPCAGSARPSQPGHLIAPLRPDHGLLVAAARR